MAMHQGQFSQPLDAPLAESTISDTINHVAAVFRENGYRIPNRMSSATLLLLWHQLRPYKKNDPKEVQKKLFPSAYFASSFPQNPHNFAKQWAILQVAPISGRCTPANMQIYLKHSKGKQCNCASEILPSSRTANSCNTTLHLFIWGTVFRSRLKHRRMTERLTPLLSGGQRMSYFAL